MIVWISGLLVLGCAIAFSKSFGLDTVFLIVFVLFITGSVAGQVKKQQLLMDRRREAKDLVAIIEGGRNDDGEFRRCCG